MMLAALAREMGWRRLTPETAGAADIDVTRAHATDLLSDVLANAPRGSVLVTIQNHMNAVAVAVHAGVKAVVFAWGRTPPEEVVLRAASEGVALYVSAESTFDVAGRLYALGLRGARPK
jgi:hypothetical protein